MARLSAICLNIDCFSPWLSRLSNSSKRSSTSACCFFRNLMASTSSSSKSWEHAACRVTDGSEAVARQEGVQGGRASHEALEEDARIFRVAALEDVLAKRAANRRIHHPFTRKSSERVRVQ